MIITAGRGHCAYDISCKICIYEVVDLTFAFLHFGIEGKVLNPSLININCAIDICCPRHNQTLHFSSERAALWHPGTSLSTSSSQCVSKNIARIAKAALHNLPGNSGLNDYIGIEEKKIPILQIRAQ